MSIERHRVQDVASPAENSRRAHSTSLWFCSLRSNTCWVCGGRIDTPLLDDEASAKWWGVEKARQEAAPEEGGGASKARSRMGWRRRAGTVREGGGILGFQEMGMLYRRLSVLLAVYDGEICDY